MVPTKNNPRDDAEASNAKKDLERENSPPLATNQQQEAAAHDDNASVS